MPTAKRLGGSGRGTQNRPLGLVREERDRDKGDWEKKKGERELNRESTYNGHQGWSPTSVVGGTELEKLPQARSYTNCHTKRKVHEKVPRKSWTQGKREKNKTFKEEGWKKRRGGPRFEPFLPTVRKPAKMGARK